MGGRACVGGAGGRDCGAGDGDGVVGASGGGKADGFVGLEVAAVVVEVGVVGEDVGVVEAGGGGEGEAGVGRADGVGCAGLGETAGEVSDGWYEG